MKNIFSLAIASVITLAATAAFAWPKLGDTAHYNLVMTGGTTTATGTLNLQITAIDAAADSVSVTETYTMQGQSGSDVQPAKLSEFQNAKNGVADVVLNCVKYKGTPEVVTFEGGNLKTCKVVDNNEKETGFMWYADVPFGFAKQFHTNTANGQTQEITMTSFIDGQ